MLLKKFNKKIIHKPSAVDDALLPNYLALFACILHKHLSVSKALTLMDLSCHMEQETLVEQVKLKCRTGRFEIGGVK